MYTRRFKWAHINESGEEWNGEEFIGITPDGDDAGVDDGNSQIISVVQADLLERRELALSTILFLDAKAERFLGNARSALAHLYMAFESLAFNGCRTVGYARVGHAETDAFLDGKSEGDDENEPPNIRAVVKKTRDWFGEGPSKTTLISTLVNPLLRYRNDIMHGRHVAPTFDEVKEAFESYEELLAWHSQVLESLKHAQ